MRVSGSEVSLISAITLLAEGFRGGCGSVGLDELLETVDLMVSC